MPLVVGSMVRSELSCDHFYTASSASPLHNYGVINGEGKFRQVSAFRTRPGIRGRVSAQPSFPSV